MWSNIKKYMRVELRTFSVFLSVDKIHRTSNPKQKQMIKKNRHIIMPDF